MKKFLRTVLVRLTRIIYNTIKDIKKFERTEALKNKLDKNLVDETFVNFKNDIKKSLLYGELEKVREYAIKTSLSNDKNNEFFYLEFGVWKGASANYFSKFVKNLYVFDSFEGLKEDWSGTEYQKSFFDLNKKIPKLNSNINPIVGWVEDTLDNFLKKYNPQINFVHLDMDTYSSTKFVLEKIKPYLVKNAIILFDELYNYIGWEHGEYRALNEVFKKEEFQYKAFNIRDVNVVIEIK